MKFTYITGAGGAHVIDVADECYNILGDDFKLVETTPHSSSSFRYAEPRPYSIRTYVGEEEKIAAQKAINEADVVRLGGAPFELVKKRINNYKLTFRSNERWFKRSPWITLLNPRNILGFYKTHFAYRNKNLHMLTMSGFLPNDTSLLHCYPGKIYKYGYLINANNNLNINDLGGGIEFCGVLAL